MDGTPVERTVDDSRVDAIRVARYVWFFYSLSFFASGLSNAPSNTPLGKAIAVSVAIFFATIFILLGLFTDRIPLVSTFLGSVIGLGDVIMNIASVLQGGTLQSTAIIYTFSAYYMIQGFIASIKLMSSEKKVCPR